MLLLYMNMKKNIYIYIYAYICMYTIHTQSQTPIFIQMDKETQHMYVALQQLPNLAEARSMEPATKPKGPP